MPGKTLARFAPPPEAGAGDELTSEERMERADTAIRKMPGHRRLLIAQLRHFMDQNDLSQRKVSAEVGISPSTLSPYIRGEYSGDNEGLDEKVRQYLEKNAIYTFGGRETSAFVETKISQAVMQACKEVQLMQTIGIVYTDLPGAGKSIAAREYARNGRQVYVINVGICSKPKALFSAILSALREGGESKGQILGLIEEIVPRLRGKKALVILDEATYLEREGIAAIKHLWDAVEVGIVLMGNLALYSRLQKNRATVYAEFWDRMRVRKRIATQINRDDVLKILEIFHPRPSDAMVRFLTDDCAGASYRRIENVTAWAELFARNDGRKKFNLEDLERGSRRLGD